MKKVSGSMLVQQDLQELISRLNNRMDEFFVYLVKKK